MQTATTPICNLVLPSGTRKGDIKTKLFPWLLFPSSASPQQSPRGRLCHLAKESSLWWGMCPLQVGSMNFAISNSLLMSFPMCGPRRDFACMFLEETLNSYTTSKTQILSEYCICHGSWQICLGWSCAFITPIALVQPKPDVVDNVSSSLPLPWYNPNRMWLTVCLHHSLPWYNPSS